MRNFAFSLGVLLLFAASAGAQSNQQISPSPLSPLSEYALNAPAEPVGCSVNQRSAIAGRSPSGRAVSRTSAAAGCRWRLSKYSFQLYGGYTFMRFFEAPHVTQNQNGFNFGAVYYYRSGFVGAEGEMTGDVRVSVGR